MMMRAMGLVGIILMLAGGPEAQSLAEVAKKEKERRESVAGDEPARVIRDEELAASPGESLSVTGKESEPPEDEPQSSESPLTDEDSGLTPREIRDLRRKWAEVWRQQMEGAERDLEIAKDEVYQCTKASAFFFVPLAIDCNGVHERLAIAEYRLKEIRANRYNWELLLPEQRPSSPDS